MFLKARRDISIASKRRQTRLQNLIRSHIAVKGDETNRELYSARNDS